MEHLRAPGYDGGPPNSSRFLAGFKKLDNAPLSIRKQRYVAFLSGAENLDINTEVFLPLIVPKGLHQDIADARNWKIIVHGDHLSLSTDGG